MKKLMIAAAGLLVVLGSLVIWANSRDLVEVSSEITVNATPAEVWTVLANIEDWQNWSTAIQKSSGLATLGAELDITMRGEDGGEGPRYSPIITQVLEQKHLNWQATMGASLIFTLKARTSALC